MPTIGETEVRNLLEPLEFTVTKIPELSTQETPDFLVEDKNAQYLIEVKDRGDKKFIELLIAK